MDPHTVKAFDEDLEKIRALVAEMGGLAEQAIYRADEALMHHDEIAGASIIAGDTKIDQISEEVERQCVRLIALRAPMADDLREILSAFKIAIIVERMGDCARSIAEQVPMVRGFGRRYPEKLLHGMSIAAAEMVRTALDAFVKQDPAIALRVYERDEAVETLHDQLFRDLIEAMSDMPSTITASTCLLLASHKLHRIGAHAINIARVVHFSTTGTSMPGHLARAAEPASI